MIFLLIAFLFPLNSYYCIRQINIYNRCPFPVWPGIVGPGNPAGGGFRLDNEQDRKISVEDSWQGIIWGRTFCDSHCQRAGGCISDINEVCPERMRITNGRRRENGNVVGCRSPCDALRSDRECCRGAFSTPDTCFRSHVAQTFKDACPTAFSFQFDDATSSFACQNDAEYLVQFC
ncbi:hypothetical protein L3Y34_003641 [Caenorhabditis briggsae]|uniref:Uncharacterized protein n=1 Tax=Caenorhabditis briggsae TaxID=6238 RepID=A0AAE9ABV7_CAEBR|nr:hypothetical protein L3Y34_003641 [Caenorhabditis briggsae]